VGGGVTNQGGIQHCFVTGLTGPGVSGIVLYRNRHVLDGGGLTSLQRARAGRVPLGQTMFEKLLFSTDFSEYAKSALPCIAGFPGAREVILLHVCEEARSTRGGGDIGEIFLRACANLLHEEKHTLEHLGPALRVTTVVKTSSDIPGAILDTAEETGASLIVLGARGNSLVEGILLGSVSTAVLRRARTSVLVIRHKMVESLTGKTYEMFCPMILARLLCPVDFSSHSDHAIALLRATPGVREVILLHVISRGETGGEIEEATREARDQVETIGNSLASQGIAVRTMMRTGDPASLITAISDEEDVSVIWMSSHGKGWFRDVLLGSTASSVAMNARRPVLVIRAPGEQGTEKAAISR
jgi:nucleotide-binding universal stress UspA family protein